MVELSKRLARVASYIDKEVILADIGSDHAYIPCYCVQKGIVSKAYAGEVVEGPFLSSKKTIEENGLGNQVVPVLSDGLKAIPSDVNEFVIAGMGAYTILSILQDSTEKVENCLKAIVQTNSHAELIRAYINEKKYKIVNEEMVEEDGKYYEIIVFEPNGQATSLNDEEIYFGPCHLKEKSDLMRQYYQGVLATKQNILAKLNASNPKYSVLDKECRMIERMLQS